LRTLLLLFAVLGSSLAVFGAWGILVFGLVAGLAICFHNVESLLSLTLALILACLILLVGWLRYSEFESVHEAARRAGCISNLNQIAAALQAYHQANGCFPPAYVADKNGKPMHSWRAMIMPYLVQDVSTAYKFAEPWNGPTNKRLLAYGTATPFYACPNDATMLQKAAVLPMGALQTSYFAVVGPNAAWAGEKSRKLADFGTDVASTVMLVEVANSGIAWAEPEDFSLETLGLVGAGSAPLTMATEHRLRDNFFFTYDRGWLVNVAMADGSVRCLPLGSMSTAELQTVLQIGGCTGHKFDEPVRHPNWPNIAALAVWLLSVGTLLVLAVRSRKARM
jgi:prepilin-type processing-associated H-X9-DG protein